MGVPPCSPKRFFVSLNPMQNGQALEDSLKPAASANAREKQLVFLLSILAAIRVFIFSAAFPFFNNVDEPMHFDLVVKYSHGSVPRGKERISPDSAADISLFSSCAYFGTPDKFPGGQMPSPPWIEPAQKMQQDLALNSAGWNSLENYEVSQPPLYYALTGLAWHFGQRLHFDSGHLLYWLRFLNISLVFALVWLAYITASIVFPEIAFLRLTAPSLLAFMPQTAFYSIGNDILSPLCFGLVFIFILKWFFCESPALPVATGAGLAVAATYLAKTTNLPLLAIAAGALLFKLHRDILSGKFRTRSPNWIAFFLCTMLPITGWIFWCKSHFGDLTGSKLKAEHFGWTVKPFGQWWYHPIFTPAGFWAYLSGQLGSFWQGEFLWHNQPLLLPGSTTIYTILALTLSIAALAGLFQKNSKVIPSEKYALLFSAACLCMGLGFFGLMSILYDFHDCPNPSRDHPYFQAGRMLLGMLIPFVLLIAYGLNWVLDRFGTTVKFCVLMAMVLAMLISEIATDWSVFSNNFNWFHLP